jgi:hypothetical protein
MPVEKLKKGFRLVNPKERRKVKVFEKKDSLESPDA